MFQVQPQFSEISQNLNEFHFKDDLNFHQSQDVYFTWKSLTTNFFHHSSRSPTTFKLCQNFFFLSRARCKIFLPHQEKFSSTMSLLWLSIDIEDHPGAIFVPHSRSFHSMLLHDIFLSQNNKLLRTCQTNNYCNNCATRWCFIVWAWVLSTRRLFLFLSFASNWSVARGNVTVFFPFAIICSLIILVDSIQRRNLPLSEVENLTTNLSHCENKVLW